MPSILKVRVISARDLPVMNRSSELTDAYVELHFADYPSQTTDICKKSLNPLWNEDFRFEIGDDQDVMLNPFEVRVYDHDTITANDIVGTASINLLPLLNHSSECEQISGWFPIYDTIKGIRGEIQLNIRLQLLEDLPTAPIVSHSARETSVVNVLVFNSTVLPSGYEVISIDGFIEELILEDDPEHHWTDNFRTSRASNETRQRLLFTLSGRLRRLLAKKALDMGCNAIVGYRQCIDLEGEWGIVIRSTGTACRLANMDSSSPSHTNMTEEDTRHESYATDNNDHAMQLESFPENDAILYHNALSASQSLNETQTPSLQQRQQQQQQQEQAQQEKEEQDPLVDTNLTSKSQYSLLSRKHEVQFLTLDSFPSGVVVHIGGIVSARSVKIITDSDRESRDSWWTELRDEMRLHARQLACPYIVGYTESCVVSEDLCVMSAYGTAVLLDLSQATAQRKQHKKTDKRSMWTRKKRLSGCRACHIPYHRHRPPFMADFVPCQVCGRRYVPDMLLSSIEPPAELYVLEEGGGLVQAFVCRMKRHESDEEENAELVGDALPFMEYEIHRQLVCKLKMHGYNAIFGLKMKFSMGSEWIALMAYGTGLVVPSLPLPSPLQIQRNITATSNDDSDGEMKTLAQIEKHATELSVARIAKAKEKCEAFMAHWKSQQRARNNRRGKRKGDPLQDLDRTPSKTTHEPLTDHSALPPDQGRTVASAETEDKKKRSLLEAVKARLTPSQERRKQRDPHGQSDAARQKPKKPREPATLDHSEGSTDGSSTTTTTASHSSDSSDRSTDSTSTTSSSQSDTDVSVASDDSQGHRATPTAWDNRQDSPPKDATAAPPWEKRARSGYVVALDDVVDQDLLTVLLDAEFPAGLTAGTLQMPLALRRIAHRQRGKSRRQPLSSTDSGFLPHARLMTLLRRFTLHRDDRAHSRQLARATHRILSEVVLSVRALMPCHLCGLDYDLQIIHHQIQLLCHVTVLVERHDDRLAHSELWRVVESEPARAATRIYSLQSVVSTTTSSTGSLLLNATPSRVGSLSSAYRPRAVRVAAVERAPSTTLTVAEDVRADAYVNMTTMPRLAHARIDRYVGRLSLTLIKETAALHEHGGLGYFAHLWLSDVYALVRTHVRNSGGNAVLSLQWHQCLLADNAETRDQAYCMVTLTGDMVQLSYDGETGVEGGNSPDDSLSLVKLILSG